MREISSPLEERLKALVRCSAPGEVKQNNFIIQKNAKPRSVSKQEKQRAATASRRRPAPDAAVEPIRRPYYRRRSRPSGGILCPRRSTKTWTVNIRPRAWGNSDKIWFGKIPTEEDAKCVADLVFHYIGQECVHKKFPATDQLPPFLNDKLRGLRTKEDRMRYVLRISKDAHNLAERKAFIQSVKENVEFVKFVKVSSYEVPSPTSGPMEKNCGPALCSELPELHEGMEQASTQILMQGRFVSASVHGCNRSFASHLLKYLDTSTPVSANYVNV